MARDRSRVAFEARTASLFDKAPSNHHIRHEGQRIPKPVEYGVYDGCAVRFTSDTGEIWVMAGKSGTWHEPSCPTSSVLRHRSADRGGISPKLRLRAAPAHQRVLRRRDDRMEFAAGLNGTFRPAWATCTNSPDNMIRLAVRMSFTLSLAWSKISLSETPSYPLTRTKIDRPLSPCFRSIKDLGEDLADVRSSLALQSNPER